MNGRDSFKRCKHCGRMIGIIRVNAYKKIIVDADPVTVHQDRLGDEYIRIDGSRMRGIPDNTYEDCEPTAEVVWRRHRCGDIKDEM